jgi:hypothetical protein
VPSALPRMLENIFGHDTGMDYGPAPMPTGQGIGGAVGPQMAQPQAPMPEMQHNPGSGDWSNIPFDPNWQGNGNYEYDPGRADPRPQNLREYGITSGAIRPTDPLTALRPVQQAVGEAASGAARSAVGAVEPALPYNWIPDSALPEPLQRGREWLNNAGENAAAAVVGGVAESMVPASTPQLVGEFAMGGGWRGLHGFGANALKEGPAYAIKDALWGAEGAVKQGKTPDMLYDAAMRKNQVVAAAAARMAAEGNVEAAGRHLNENLQFMPARQTPLSTPFITEAPHFSPEMRGAKPGTALADYGGYSISGTSGLQSTGVRAMLGADEYPPEVLKLLGIDPTNTAATGDHVANVEALKTGEGYSVTPQARITRINDNTFSVTTDTNDYFVHNPNEAVAQAFKDSPGGGIIDQAMNAEGGALMSHEDIRHVVDDLKQSEWLRDGSTVRKEGDNLYRLDSAGEDPRFFDNLDEAVREGGGPTNRPGFHSVNADVASQNRTYLDMDLADLEYAKQKKLQDIYDRNRHSERMPRELDPNHVQAVKALQPDEELVHSTDAAGNKIKIKRSGNGRYFMVDDVKSRYSTSAATPQEALDIAERMKNNETLPDIKGTDHTMTFDEARAAYDDIGEVATEGGVILEGNDGKVYYNDGRDHAFNTFEEAWAQAKPLGPQPTRARGTASNVGQNLLTGMDDELQAYNELRQIQAAIDLKTGQHTVLSDALNNIVRNVGDGNIEYLNAGFNPFPYLSAAIRKLAAASQPGIGPYRGLTIGDALHPGTAMLGAMNVPEVAARGTLGMDEAIKLAGVQALAPGKLLGPEGSVRRKLVGIVDPAANMPQHINVANQAGAGVHVLETSRLKAGLDPISHDLKNAWAADPPHYLDPASGKLASGRDFPENLVDYLENPDLYEGGHTDLPILSQAYGVQQAINTNDMRGRYDSAVELYHPDKPNAVYVMHLRAVANRTELEQALGGFRADMTNKPGISKGRSYASIRDRLANPNTPADWTPELDLDVLSDMHSRALAREAAINTFQKGAGGLTKTQVIDLEFPGIRQARDRLRASMDSYKGRLETASLGERNAARQGMRTFPESKRIAGRMDDLERRINNLGDDYGPELSYLSGQYHELEITASRLLDKRNQLTAAAQGYHYDVKSYTQALDQIHSDLKQTIDNYNSANVKDRNWLQAAGTNRYWNDENAIKAVEKFSKRPESTGNWLFNAADEAHAWQLGPDFSPLSIQGTMLGALSHPIAAFFNAGKLSQAWALSDDVLFGSQNIDPSMRDLFEFTTKTPLTGRIPLSAEVRMQGRGLERLARTPNGPLKVGAPVAAAGRAVTNFNEGIDRTLLYFRYKMWENDVRALTAGGLPIEQAASEAWAAQGKIVPQIAGVETGRRSFMGFETTQSRLERAAQTSVSFTVQPFNFTKDYLRGMQNFMTKQPMTGRQKLAVRRGTTMFTALSAITAASAAQFDDGSGRSTEERMFAAIDPRSSDFWKLQLGGGKSIPLGGPFRRAYRGAVNIAGAAYSTATGDKPASSVADALFQYGRSGLPNYVSGPLDTAKNEDFYGRTITDERIGDPGWFNDVGQYALEQVNITAGVPFRAVRTGEGGSPEDIAIGLGSQFGGVNLIESSPATQYRNKLLTEGIPALTQAGIIPATDVDGKPITSLDQLGSGEYDAAQRWMAQNDPALDHQRKQYQLDREQMFAIKDVERKARDAKYTPAYDALYHEMLTGARSSRDILSDLADIRHKQQGEIQGLYDDKSYQSAISTLPDNSMRKLEDEWFKLTSTVKGYVAEKPLTEEQWVEAEQKQAAFLSNLDSRSPGLAARFQKNLDLRDSVVDSHPLIKLKREVDTASDEYYNVGPDQRKQMLVSDPKLNIARWVLYGDALHTIGAADSIVHKTFEAMPDSQLAKAMAEINLDKRDIKVELNGVSLPRSIGKDIPLWDATKNAINAYSKTDSADRTRILTAAPGLNAALVYWGASDRLHSTAASAALDSYMSRLNWPLWNTTLKPQVTAYMQLTDRQQDQMRVQYPNLDAAWNVFQNYLSGRAPTLRSEPARKEYARIMGIRVDSEEYKRLDLNTQPPLPQR